MLRRIQVQADNIFQLFGELRIVAEFEDLNPMRLQSMSMPDPPYTGFTDADSTGHAASAPVRCILWSFLRCLTDDLFGVQLSRTARARSIPLDSHDARF